jgi:hypothetical protein
LWPEILVVTDGTFSATTLLRPVQYGEGGIYEASGTHISAATGEQLRAIMHFNLDSAEMLSLIVLPEVNGIVTPWRIDPQIGDQFLFDLSWQDLNNGEWFTTDGDVVLTFGDEGLWLDTIPSVPGQYEIGAIVVDLDGNPYYRGTMLSVDAD